MRIDELARVVRAARARGRTALAVVALVVWAARPGPLGYPDAQLGVRLYAQERTATDATARRIADRIRALQGEADRLAAQARTLLGDLRQFELQRDIAVERASQSQSDVAQAEASLAATADRLRALEGERVAQLPDLKVRLVDIYKRGRHGYAPALLDARGVREFARAMRATMALSVIAEKRIAEHRDTLARVRRERDALARRTRELAEAATNAERARASAQRAVTDREALVARIDARRDLNAQLAGELTVAADRLREYVASLTAGRPSEPVAVPLRPFRGELDWPVTGPVVASASGGSDRPAGSPTSASIDIGAAEGVPVLAVHSGTVDFADAFAGFGRLVILDHGAGAYSLYGYLGSIAVGRGAHVDAGTELGRVGTPPTGPARLYFELRVDGRSVDPVQWLRPR